MQKWLLFNCQVRKATHVSPSLRNSKCGILFVCFGRCNCKMHHESIESDSMIVRVGNDDLSRRMNRLTCILLSTARPQMTSYFFQYPLSHLEERTFHRQKRESAINLEGETMEKVKEKKVGY